MQLEDSGIRFSQSGPGVFRNIVIFVAISVLIGCASRSKRISGIPDTQRLEILTSFSTALNARNYGKATEFLTPEDRANIVDSDGGVSPEFQERLSALKLSTLNKSPSIKIVDGKISGVFARLPVLEQAPIPGSGIEILDDPDSPVSNRSDAAFSKTAQADLRAVTARFFQSVRDRRWHRALEYLDDREKTVFAMPNGDLRVGTRRRLSAADTSSWSALTLKDGKLTGLVLIVPPLSSLGLGRPVY